MTPTGMAGGDPGSTPVGTAGTTGGTPMAGSGAPPATDGGVTMPPPMVPTFDCTGVQVECVNGMAGQYACSGINLLAHLGCWTVTANADALRELLDG